MISLKSSTYKKACRELYEILINLSDEEKRKIPKSYFEYVRNNMDETYDFKINKSRRLLDQDLMIQTQAMIIGVYENYLAPESEKEYWAKYDKKCYKKIEDKKKEKYPVDVFSSNNTNNKIDNVYQKDSNDKVENQNEYEERDEMLLANIKKENIFERILGFFKGKSK